MIKSIINVYNKWKVIVFVDVDYDRYDIIETELTNILASTKVINSIYDNINHQYNKAFTYSNLEFKTSIVGINKTTSRSELIDSIVHEIDHVQYDICSYYGIDLGSEDAAYLIGYLAKSFYKSCSKLFCNY